MFDEDDNYLISLSILITYFLGNVWIFEEEVICDPPRENGH